MRPKLVFDKTFMCKMRSRLANEAEQTVISINMALYLKYSRNIRCPSPESPVDVIPRMSHDYEGTAPRYIGELDLAVRKAAEIRIHINEYYVLEKKDSIYI